MAMEQNNDLRTAWDFVENTGRSIFLTGKAGTGKTTLIKCLNGLNEINSGEILINGENINKLSFRQISKHIGYKWYKQISDILPILFESESIFLI